jgi:hypothetical protein
MDYGHDLHFGVFLDPRAAVLEDVDLARRAAATIRTCTRG